MISIQGTKMIYSSPIISKKLAWLVLLLSTTPTFSAVNPPGLANSTLPLPPRASVWGSTGNNTFGEGDAMVPIFGNPNQLFFGDLALKFGDDRAWFTSLGLGGRKIFFNNIFGAYLFADYNRTPNANYFTVINPGIEWMTNSWDSHLNVYVPVGRKDETINTYTGTALGRSNTLFFRGHALYDQLFNLLENVGPGVDLEIGHTFGPSSYIERTRFFVGGYHFAPQYTSNVNGVLVGFETPLNNKWITNKWLNNKWTTLELSDSYDNVNRNTFLITLRFTLGGLDKSGAPNIHDRMLDRIPRHLGNLYNGNGIPSQKVLVNKGRAKIIQDNIWFFVPDGTPTLVRGLQSCTFENPCIGLAQEQIDAINALAANANFYFAPGTYNNLTGSYPSFSFYNTVNTGFSFYNGQNLYGRTENYMQSATGNDRPLLNDSVLLAGNNDLNDLRVFANSIHDVVVENGEIIPFQTGILVVPSASGVVNISNTDVVSLSLLTNALAVGNDSPTTTLNLKHSTISSSTFGIPAAITVGVGAISRGNLNVNDSTVTINESDLSNISIVFGVVNNENATVNITNSTIVVNAINSALTAGVLNNSTVGRGTVNISGSSILVVGDNSNTTADVFNQANNASGLAGTVNINQSSLSMTSNNNLGGIGANIFTTNDSTVNLTNSVLTSSGNDGNIFGIFIGDPLSTVNFQNNTISVNLAGTAMGAPIVNFGTLNDNGGNQCFLDGVAVPC
jgi:hypothetical protein